MSAPHDCPGPERWQALLDDAVPPAQREEYERHLETCADCQDRLHRVEEIGETLRRVARQVGDPTTLTNDPALTRVLERLHEAKPPPSGTAPEPPDLSFLTPSDRPGVLGTLGGYEVHGVVGQGGMGVVLKAYEPALHRLVAIKVLAPALAGSATARRRFTREAQAAAAACHDHVVAVHGVDAAAGLPYLVMQFVAGESLQDRLDRAGPLAVDEAVRVGLQTAAGLAAAHAQGLIHRDIKPANLLLEDGRARVKITDFGLARTADDVGLTQQGVVAGTPEYMAPEQARGEPVDHRADLFSLGSVLYAMLTGRPPFRGSTTLAVLRRVCEEAPPPIRSLTPDVPAWLEALIGRLLAKDPAGRFQSAAEVATLLAGYLAHLLAPATVSPPALPPAREARGPGRPAPRFGTHTTRLLGLLGPGLLAALLVWLVWQGMGTPGSESASTGLQAVFHPDLRTVALDGENLRAVADGVSQDTQGVRVTLPAGQGPPGHKVHLRTAFAVRGDFEITARFGVLKADRPDTGYGVGVSLYAALDPHKNNAASLARRVMTDGQTLFVADRLKTLDGQLTHQVETSPATAATFRLRLERVGARLRYLVADGDAPEFVLIKEVEWGVDEVRPVQVGGDAGGSLSGLDARLLDFSIRARELPGATELASVAVPGPPLVRKVWLALPLVMTLAMGGWLALRPGRRAAPAAAPGADPRAPSAVATGPAVFPCAHCGKGLNSRAELAGKKVKCPHCGEASVVPPGQAGDVASRP